MSTGVPQIAITVDLSGGVTITPALQYLDTPIPSAIQTGAATEFSVVWTPQGGTFSDDSFAWNDASLGLTQPALQSDGTLALLNFTPPMSLAPPFTLWYTITAGSANATGQLQYMSAWGYPDTYSVNPGDTLPLHVASTAPWTGIRVYPLTAWRQNMAQQSDWAAGGPLQDLGTSQIGGSLQPDNDGTSGINDWNWKSNVQLTIDSTWTSGIYIIEFAAYATQTSDVQITTTWTMFVVRNPSPQPGTILYKWPLNTIFAYTTAMHPYLPDSQNNPMSYDNDFYANPVSPEGNTTLKVTLRRPASLEWQDKAVQYDFPMVTWLIAQGYTVDYCTDVDVELDTDLAMLSQYPMVLFRGHDEYLGKQTYENLTSYRNNGGNIVFLSGNICCWRVTYTDDDDGLPTAFVCDKGEFRACDIDGPDAWWVLGQYDNKLAGVGSRNAAIYDPDWAVPFGAPPADEVVAQSPGYTVVNSDHWIYAGAGVDDGYVIGIGNVNDENGKPLFENLIGYEAGGALLLNSTAPYRLALTDGTPPNFALLGVGVTPDWVAYCGAQAGTTQWVAFSREGMSSHGAPNPPIEGNHPAALSGIYAATMGFYSNYGQVFAAASTHWVMILNEWNYSGNYYQYLLSTPYPGSWTSSSPGKYLGNPAVNVLTQNVLNALKSPAKTLCAVGDLNGDGLPDLVLQAAGSGEPLYWLLDGTARTAAGSILYDGSGAPGSTWRIAGVASLTAANSTEIILQNPSDGSLQYWTVSYSSADGTLTRTASAPLVAADAPGSEWKLGAVIPLSSGTGAYLIFQNQNNGSLWYWQLTGTKQTASAALNPSYQPGNVTWALAASVDLNGDGSPDLVFYNAASNSLYYWLLNGITYVSDGPITGPATPGAVVGAGIFSSGGAPAVVFQSPTGALSYWTIQQFAESTSGSFTPSSNAWFLGGAS